MKTGLYEKLPTEVHHSQFQRECDQRTFAESSGGGTQDERNLWMPGGMRTEEACQRPYEEVAQQLGTDLRRGLSWREANRRLVSLGPNEFEVRQEEPLWKKYSEQIGCSEELQKQPTTTETKPLVAEDPKPAKPVDVMKHLEDEWYPAAQETSSKWSPFYDERSSQDRFGARLKHYLRLPLHIGTDRMPPATASNSLVPSFETTGAHDTNVKDVPASAQMDSFWSMWNSRTRNAASNSLRTSDLACAVATILIASIIILTSYLLLPPVKAEGPDGRIVVSGPFGRVRGLALQASGRRVYAFLGLPYAEPPVLERRFKRTVLRRAPADGDKEVLDGLKLLPACLQYAYAEPLRTNSEDCLHLNIWTPQVNRCKPNWSECGTKSVVFFLHGGFFQVGGNRNDHLDGRYLAALGDVVVVVPNYRLGALGFLFDNTDEAPGNVGLDDQLLALEWTRANIGSFGGNGSDLTLMGHGAGATSIGYFLLNSGGSRGLASSRAILMSESPFTRQADNTVSHLQQVERLASTVNCIKGKGSMVRCLRHVSADELMRPPMVPMFSADPLPPLHNFVPSFTGWLQNSPFELRRSVNVTSTKVSGLQVLLGHLDDDGSHFTSLLESRDLLQPSLAPRLLQEFGLNATSSTAVSEHYLRSSTGGLHRWAGNLLGDMLVVCPVRHFADYLRQSGGNIVQRYLLARGGGGDLGRGAQRTYALQLAFGNPIRLESHADEQALSRRVIALWTNFAKTGHVPALKGETIYDYSLHISGPEDNGGALSFRKTECDFLKDYYL
ncbi:cholinesterase [Ixodes scapularis]